MVNMLTDPHALKVGRNDATVESPVSLHDRVVYARVRINEGTVVGQWAALLEPWTVTSDCTKSFYLDDLDDKQIYPDLWLCSFCVRGSSCDGDIRWNGVKSKFGYWRVPSKPPQRFQTCHFGASCLGFPNTQLAGKFYNSTEQLEEFDLALFKDQPEYCNEKWGHAQMCDNQDGRRTRCRLCATCSKGYRRVGFARCKPCPESTTNRVLLGVGALAVVGGFCIVIWFSIEAAGSEKQVSETIKKILVNYLQVASMAMLFPLRWPEEVEIMFQTMSAVSSPAQSLLSPDCELSVMAPAVAFYGKQVGFSVFPLVVCMFCWMFWAVLSCCFRKRSQRSRIYYTDRTVLSIVSSLFLLFPTMVKQSLAGLACEKVGDNYYLSIDLQEPCMEGRHLDFVLTLTLPQIFLYVLAMPIGAVLFLRRYKKKLDDPQLQFRYGILYNGYRKEKYYWELTIAIRKVTLVIMAGIYGSRLGPDLQVHFALLLLMFFTLSHLVADPFNPVLVTHGKKFGSDIHHLEFASLVICCLTLWFGLLFFLDYHTQRIGDDYIMLCSVAVCTLNIGYFILVTYFFARNFIAEFKTKSDIQRWAGGKVLQSLDHKRLVNNIKNESWRKSYLAVHRGREKEAAEARRHNRKQKAMSHEELEERASDLEKKLEQESNLTKNYRKKVIMKQLDAAELERKLETETKLRKHDKSTYRKQAIKEKSFRHAKSVKVLPVAEQKEQKYQHPSIDNSEWQQMTDPKSGRPYWYNMRTQESSWTQPFESPKQKLKQPERKVGLFGRLLTRDHVGKAVTHATATKTLADAELHRDNHAKKIAKRRMRSQERLLVRRNSVKATRKKKVKEQKNAVKSWNLSEMNEYKTADGKPSATATATAIDNANVAAVVGKVKKEKKMDNIFKTLQDHGEKGMQQKEVEDLAHEFGFDSDSDSDSANSQTYRKRGNV